MTDVNALIKRAEDLIEIEDDSDFVGYGAQEVMSQLIAALREAEAKLSKGSQAAAHWYVEMDAETKRLAAENARLRRVAAAAEVLAEHLARIRPGGGRLNELRAALDAWHRARSGTVLHPSPEKAT